MQRLESLVFTSDRDVAFAALAHLILLFDDLSPMLSEEVRRR